MTKDQPEPRAKFLLRALACVSLELSLFGLLVVALKVLP